MRKRVIRGAAIAFPLSALLLFLGTKLITLAYLVPPVILGFNRNRVWATAANDAESSAVPIMCSIVIALAPLWLARRKPRHFARRLIFAWMIWMGILYVGCVCHATSLWS